MLLQTFYLTAAQHLMQHLSLSIVIKLLHTAVIMCLVSFVTDYIC
jgi:hypothetical protein